MARYLFLFFALSSLRLFSQSPAENPGTLPSIIPPSPEVSTLVKAGSFNTTMYTGSASANIPLYEMTAGSIKVPLSLSYSTNGTRVNEISSRVGLGWSLNAGGSVSRTIHDEEDYSPLTHNLLPVYMDTASQALKIYAEQSVIENYDTEKDEFAFSVNGISGKFYIDSTGVVRLGNHADLKITKDGTTFTIITAAGIKYEFGKNNEIEKTRDVKTNGNQRTHKAKTTAWFLTRITSPEKDTIYFNYESIVTRAQMGPFQSVILRTTDSYYPYSSETECAALCPGQFASYGFNRVDYDSYYLTRISSTNGLQAYFVYESRPDSSGDNRLIGLNVYYTLGTEMPVPIKKFVFSYDDHPVSGDFNQRFSLKKISQVTNETSPQVIAHQFEYNSFSSLPSQYTRNQDYYGFSRGNTIEYDNFFPRPDDYTSYDYGYLGVDRSPVFETTQAGTLKKIKYPTGGTEEFIYEQNTLPQVESNPDNFSFEDSLTLNVIGSTASMAGPCDTVIHRTSIALNSSAVRVTFTTDWNTTGPAMGSSQACNPDSIHFISYFEIWDVNSNIRVFEARHKLYYTTEVFNINLDPSVEYEVRVIPKGRSTHCYALVEYNQIVEPQTTYTNLGVCGLRVKQIRSYDSLASKYINKNFKYASLEYPTRSSGVGHIKPDFFARYHGGGVCHPNSPYVGVIIFECPVGLLQASASSLSGGYTFNGSPVGYRYVIESDDTSFLNGGIEHKFSVVPQDYQPYPEVGWEIAGAGTPACIPDMNGTELETRTFKKSGSSIITVMKTTNSFSTDDRLGWSHVNYATRRRWTPPDVDPPDWFTWNDVMKGYDIGSYLYISRWWHLDQTVNVQYDEKGENPITTTTSYTYGNTAHLQVTQVSVTNSMGQTILTETKYPADVSGSVYSAMINKHILSPVIETAVTKNSSGVKILRNEYYAWPSDTIYRPQYIKSSFAGNTLENRVQYHSYDATGNPTEVSKIDDGHTSYLWNYKKTLPVAEVKNAALADIAYTSFEGDDNGQWSISGTKATGGVTGEKCFTGSLSRAISNGSYYYTITIWVKTSATVNGASGTLIVTKGNWRLYQWTINGGMVEGVSISGTEIDEVRMYPRQAQMTTYTYKPFVGITSTCDANNQITYYSYDGFTRLWLITDQDNNILKRICYNYAGQTENCTAGVTGCSNTAPDWQNTSTYRCQVDTVGQYTGYRERLQTDTNRCSGSYNQSRWVNVGLNVEDCPIPLMATISSVNTTGISGFTAVYTNRSTLVTTAFNVPSTSGTQTLGTLPEGSYDLVIYKAGQSLWLLFGSGCSYVSGTSATFYRVNITTTTCKTITIDNDN